MKKNTLLVLSLLFSAGILFSQEAKRPLTFNDILKWERITETVISNNGKFIVYKQEPWKGDPTLKITTPDAKELASFPCASDAEITFDSKFVVFKIQPPVDTIRALKLKKTKKEDLPVNKLAIYNFESQKTDTIEKLISVKVPEKWAGWIAYQTEAQKDTVKKTGGKAEAETKAEVKTEAKGKAKDDEKVYPLFVRNLKTGEVSEFPAVSSYEIAEEKAALIFISEGKDSTFEYSS